MKITKVESLHADGGWRSLDFLKISTDEGVVGWSEYNESFGGVGVSAAIAGLGPAIIGKDPRAWEALTTLMFDTRDPKALAYIRSRTTIPVASCECLFGRRDYRPYFEQQSIDVAIIDTPWKRRGRVAEDRVHGRYLRGQRRPPQLLSPPGDHDERALLRGRAERPHHGDRSRHRALIRRAGDGEAGHRRRPHPRAGDTGLGHRGQRGGGARASAAQALR